MLEVHEHDLVQALKMDLGKSRMEGVCMEVEFCRNNIRSAIADIENWVLDEHVEKNLVTLLDTTFIRREPFGVVLIMGAWNYPVQLCILPAIGAIAAGNCVIIKTSELAPATAKVMEQIFPQFLNDNCYRTVLGGVPEATGMINCIIIKTNLIRFRVLFGDYSKIENYLSHIQVLPLFQHNIYI